MNLTRYPYYSLLTGGLLEISPFLSNSRSVLKLLCDLCRKPVAEPFDDLFLAFVTTGMARNDVRLGTQPLLAFIDVELRHGHGIPEKAMDQKTDRFGVEVEIKRNQSPTWGRISSGHKPALRAVAA